MQNEPSSRQTPSSTNIFLRKNLPWLVAGGAFIFYLIFIQRWLTVDTLRLLPKIGGWDWGEMKYTPLYYILTYPIRLMPSSWQTIGINLFSVICAALTLGTLARSIRILPHDRTKDQRNVEQSDYSFLSLNTFWLPVLIGVLVCGLQFSFWKNAIAGSSEMFDLLLFALVVRCLLEARLDHGDSWLVKACLIYGVAIPNNFAMVGFLPAFIGAIIWIRGMELFKIRRLLRLVLCLCPGLVLFLVLPAVEAASGTSEETFFELLFAALEFNKLALASFPRVYLLLISLTSILPVIFIGIRWPATFGDVNAAGNFLTNLMMYIIHATFLGICVYVAFDPPFSPRQLVKSGYQLLPFYYLGALSIGYFTGYFLLVFSKRPVRSWERPSPIRIGVGYLVLGVLYLSVIALPVLLFINNLPEIKTKSSRWLYDYGLFATQSLPDEPSVILSDDPFRLHAIGSALADQGKLDQYALVNTTELIKPGYHRHLTSTYGDLWTPQYLADLPLENRVAPQKLIDAVLHQSRSARIFYIHPSFGYYFEAFDQRPRKLLYELIPYATNQVTAARLSPEEIQNNSSFWEEFDKSKLQALREQLEAESELKPEERSGIPQTIAMMYSRSLNYYGVQLQLAGKMDDAGIYYDRAIELFTNNASAYINREFLEQYAQGTTRLTSLSDEARQRVALFGGNWNAILNANGPIDEPSNNFELAVTLASQKNFRQAAHLLERVVFFNPKDYPAQVNLAVMYTRAGFPERGLEQISKIRQAFDVTKQSLPMQLGLTQAEGWALAKQGKMEEVVKLFESAQAQHPKEKGPFELLAEIYVDGEQFTKAMGVLEQQMKAQPDNDRIAIPYSWLKIQNKDHQDAVELLSEFLKKYPGDLQAMMNRALANFMSKNYDQAKADYELIVESSSNPPHQAYYGLAEIAFQQERYEDAEALTEKYIIVGPPNSAQSRFMGERLKLIRTKL